MKRSRLMTDKFKYLTVTTVRKKSFVPLSERAVKPAVDRGEQALQLRRNPRPWH